MTQAQHVVSLLGGRAETSRITGYQRTLVEGWLRGGWIHGKYHSHILQTAWAEGININAHDFVVHLHGLVRPAVAAPERTQASA